MITKEQQELSNKIGNDVKNATLAQLLVITEQMLKAAINEGSNKVGLLKLALAASPEWRIFLDSKSMLGNLEELNLSPHIRDDDLAKITNHVPSLEKLNLNSQDLHLLPIISANLAKLQELDLVNSNISSESLAKIINHAPKTLIRKEDVEDVEIVKAKSMLGNLEELNLSPHIRDDDLAKIINHAPNLKNLALNDSHHLNPLTETLIRKEDVEDVEIVKANVTYYAGGSPEAVAALSANVTAVILHPGVLPEAVAALSANVTTVDLRSGVSPEAVVALSANVTVVILHPGVSSEAVAALKENVRDVILLSGVSPEAVVALKENVTAVGLYSGVTPEVVEALKASVTTAHLFAGVSPETVAALKENVTVVGLRSGVSPKAVAALKENVTSAHLFAGVSPEAVAALNASVTTVALHPGVSLEAVTALKASVTTVILHPGISPGAVAALSANVTAVILHPGVSPEAVTALKASVTSAHLFAGVSPETVAALKENVTVVALHPGVSPGAVAALNASVTTVILHPGVSPGAVAALSANVREVILLSGVTPETVAALKENVTVVGLRSGVSPKAVAALKENVTSAHIFAGVTPEAVAALNANVTTVALHPGVSPKAVAALKASVIAVTLRSGISQKAVAALKANVIAVTLHPGVSPKAVAALSANVSEVILFSGVLPEAVAALKAHVTIRYTQHIEDLKTSSNFANNDKPPLQGIGDKYLGRPTLPPLPSIGNSNSNRYQHDGEYNFVCFAHLDKPKNKKIKTPISNIQGDPDFYSQDVNYQYKASFDFYSSRDASIKRNCVVFVFAGRGKNALFPKPTLDCRVILVATSNEYNEYQNKVPDDVDVLVVKDLNSKTNGNYETALGSINVRRLAAFIFSEICKLEHCLFLDDNVKSIPYSTVAIRASKEVLGFHDIYNFMLNERKNYNNPIIFGAATISNITKDDYKDKFCAKLHFWDLKLLRERGIVGNRLCYLIYEAKNVNCWGGDYFFHNFIWELFINSNHNLSHADGKKRNAFATIDPSILGLKRSLNNLNAFSKIAIKIEDILNNETNLGGICYVSSGTDVNDNYDICDDPEREYTDARLNAGEYLKETIKDNLKRYDEKAEKIFKVDLLNEHARVNAVTYNVSSTGNAQCLISQVPNFTENFFVQLEKNKRDFGCKILRPYQLAAIDALLKDKNTAGSLVMATGSGKTRVQIFLAITALQLKLGKPIVIVTPTQNLVEQFYRDFIDTMNIFNEHVQNDKVQPWQVIKVMSGEKNISANLLSMNTNIVNKDFVAIFCLASYKKILNIKSCNEIKLEEFDGEEEPDNIGAGKPNFIAEAMVVLLDEYHLYPNALAAIKDNIIGSPLIYGLTATPKANKLFVEAPLFTYTPAEALIHRIIPPINLHHLAEYYRENVADQNFPEKIYNFMVQCSHPNGRNLLEHKTVIFLPQIKDVKKFAEYFKENKINCFEIHSKNPSHKDDLAKFHNLKNNCIALACQMMGVGYSDNYLDTVIFLKNGKEANVVTQAVGRALRINPEKTDKAVLIVGYNDINIEDLCPVIEASKIYLSNQHHAPSLSIQRAVSSHATPLVFSAIAQDNQVTSSKGDDDITLHALSKDSVEPPQSKKAKMSVE